MIIPRAARDLYSERYRRIARLSLFCQDLYSDSYRKESVWPGPAARASSTATKPSGGRWNSFGRKGMRERRSRSAWPSGRVTEPRGKPSMPSWTARWRHGTSWPGKPQRTRRHDCHFTISSLAPVKTRVIDQGDVTFRILPDEQCPFGRMASAQFLL